MFGLFLYSMFVYLGNYIAQGYYCQPDVTTPYSCSRSVIFVMDSTSYIHNTPNERGQYDFVETYIFPQLDIRKGFVKVGSIAYGRMLPSSLYETNRSATCFDLEELYNDTISSPPDNHTYYMADTIDDMYKMYNGFNYTTIVMFIASENTTDVDFGGVKLSHFLGPGMKVAVISYGNESYTTFPKNITTIYNWKSYPSKDLGQLIQGEICDLPTTSTSNPIQSSVAPTSNPISTNPNPSTMNTGNPVTVQTSQNPTQLTSGAATQNPPQASTSMSGQNTAQTTMNPTNPGQSTVVTQNPAQSTTHASNPGVSSTTGQNPAQTSAVNVPTTSVGPNPVPSTSTTSKNVAETTTAKAVATSKTPNPVPSSTTTAQQHQAETTTNSQHPDQSSSISSVSTPGTDQTTTTHGANELFRSFKILTIITMISVIVML